MKRSLVLVATVLCLALAATPAQAAIPHEFIDGPGNEWTAAVRDDVVAWAPSPTKASYIHMVKVREGAAAAQRISKAGTDAIVGNIELGGPNGDVVLFFQGANKGDGQWDVKVWDLEADDFLALPSVINSSKSEIYGAIGGDYLLFSRGPVGNGQPTKVLLYRFSTQDLTTLGTAPTGGSATAGGLEGDYATYTVCPRNYECNVFRYTLSTEARKKVPNPNRANYYSSVTADGTVYYVQGDPDFCGHHTKLMRFANGNTAALDQLAEGIEVGPTSNSTDTGTGDVTMYFTRIQCRGFRTGIWNIDG
jgi:hypothetical protein